MPTNEARPTRDAWVIDAGRTPFGRLGGELARARPDDLAAHVVRSLLARGPELDRCPKTPDEPAGVAVPDRHTTAAGARRTACTARAQVDRAPAPRS